MKRIIAATLALATAACGQTAPLEPAAGEQLPPEPFGKTYTPGPEELLEPSQQAVPERTVELRERSEEREDDPFDLPPE